MPRLRCKSLPGDGRCGGPRYKCTCPSRKFQCKHNLALFWMFAKRPDDLLEGEPPDGWSMDGRRKKSGGSKPPAENKPAPAKDISSVEQETSSAVEVEDPAERERKVKAAQRRQAQTGSACWMEWTIWRTGLRIKCAWTGSPPQRRPRTMPQNCCTAGRRWRVLLRQPC
jgi:hypothetical protein